MRIFLHLSSLPIDQTHTLHKTKNEELKQCMCHFVETDKGKMQYPGPRWRKASTLQLVKMLLFSINGL